MDCVAAKLPFAINTILNNGRAKFESYFHWPALDKDINHVYTKPRRPRPWGSDERSHRIDADELYRLLERIAIDDADLFNTKLGRWKGYHVYQRTYDALGEQTP